MAPTDAAESLEVITAESRRGFAKYDSTEHGSLSVEWDGLYETYDFRGGAENGDSERLFKGLATNAAIRLHNAGHLKQISSEPWKDWLGEMRSRPFGFGEPGPHVEVHLECELARRKKTGEPIPVVKGESYQGPELGDLEREWLTRHDMPTSRVGSQLRFAAEFQKCERVFRKSAEFCDALLIETFSETEAQAKQAEQRAAANQAVPDDAQPAEKVQADDMLIGRLANERARPDAVTEAAPFVNVPWSTDDLTNRRIRAMAAMVERGQDFTDNSAVCNALDSAKIPLPDRIKGIWSSWTHTYLEGGKSKQAIQQMLSKDRRRLREKFPQEQLPKLPAVSRGRL